LAIKFFAFKNRKSDLKMQVSATLEWNAQTSSGELIFPADGKGQTFKFPIGRGLYETVRTLTPVKRDILCACMPNLSDQTKANLTKTFDDKVAQVAVSKSGWDSLCGFFANDKRCGVVKTFVESLGDKSKAAADWLRGETFRSKAAFTELTKIMCPRAESRVDDVWTILDVASSWSDEYTSSVVAELKTFEEKLSHTSYVYKSLATTIVELYNIIDEAFLPENGKLAELIKTPAWKTLIIDAVNTAEYEGWHWTCAFLFGCLCVCLLHDAKPNAAAFLNAYANALMTRASPLRLLKEK